MAEGGEAEEAEGEAPLEGASVGVALALDEARADPSLRGDVAAFLQDQRALIAVQTHHLHEQFKHLKLRLLIDRVKLGVQLASLAIVAVGLAIVLALVGQAMGDHSLVVAGFSAPPSFAERGLTGQVLAEDLMGEVGAIRATAMRNSLTRSNDVRAEQAEALKLEIPETGLSFDEVERALHHWLGHATQLDGELRDLGDGQIALSLHMTGSDPITVTGPAADLDELVKQAAEQAFASFDPVNYVIYLSAVGRQADSYAAAQKLAAAAATPLERANAYSLLSDVDVDERRALARARLAADLDARTMVGWIEAAVASSRLGLAQTGLAMDRRLLTVRRQDQAPSQRESVAAVFDGARARIARQLGDFPQVEKSLMEDDFVSPPERYAQSAQAAGLMHDPARSRRQLANALAIGAVYPEEALETLWYESVGGGDWPRALSAAQALVDERSAEAQAAPPLSHGGRSELKLATVYRPWLAYAKAMTGDLAGAGALIGSTPLDCYLCLRERGRIASAAKDWAAADRWFAEAARQGPDLPLAHADWGASRLDRGDLDGAIAQFTLAHRKGPRFADPLELWGEALVRKGDARGAAAKFAQAAKSAPGWRRNRLMWAQALAALGRDADAKAQLDVAAKLEREAAATANLPSAPPDSAQALPVASGRRSHEYGHV